MTPLCFIQMKIRKASYGKLYELLRKYNSGLIPDQEKEVVKMLRDEIELREYDMREAQQECLNEIKYFIYGN